jgi:hypothetical protein
MATIRSFQWAKSGIGMSLSFLYRSHFEMCCQMASASKDPEIREQWTELGEYWRKKAEADEHQISVHTAPSNLIPLPVAGLAPPQPKFEVKLNVAMDTSTSSIPEQRLEMPLHLTPTLISEAVPVQGKAKPTLPPFGGSSDIWAKIASPISLES